MIAITKSQLRLCLSYNDQLTISKRLKLREKVRQMKALQLRVRSFNFSDEIQLEFKGTNR